MLRTEYPTRPLECWPKMKELRRTLFREYWENQDKGNPLMLGGYGNLSSLPSGVDGRGAGLGIYYARVMRDRDLLLKCHQTMDEMGYGPEICATLRVNLASMFMGFQMRSPKGKLYKPDFIIEFHICDSQSKSTQIAWEHYQIPYFVLEIPLFPPERVETGKDYMVAQMDACIRWMEKVTGKEYDDEKLIKAVYNEWDGRVLWSRVAEFQKATPAPLDQKMFNSFATLMMWGPHQQPVTEVLWELYDETRQRVDEGIAAVSTERCRLLHEGQPPWFHRAFLRYPNLYGASYLGSAYLWGLWGAFRADEDGTWTVPLTPRERGTVLRNREDALRSLADLALDHSPIVTSHMVAPQVAATVKMVKDWHVDGVVLHIDRGCKGQSAANAETRLALREENIPCMVYESNNADPREFSEAQVMDRMDSFLESLGVSRLEAFSSGKDEED